MILAEGLYSSCATGRGASDRMSKDRLESLGSALGASVEWHSDEACTLRGSAGSRRYALRVDVGSGPVELHLGIVNRRGVIVARTGLHAPDADAMAEAGFERETIEDLVGPGIYLEHFPGEKVPMREVLAAVPAAALADIGRLMREGRVERLIADNDRIQVECTDFREIPLREMVTLALGVCSQMASTLEVGESQIAPRPRLFIGGEAVPAGPRVRCRFCGGAVVLDSKGRCPTCGGAHTGDAPQEAVSEAEAVASEPEPGGRAAAFRLMDWLRLPLLGGGWRFDNLDTDRRSKLAASLARRLAASTGARLEEPLGNEPSLNGSYGGRPFAVRLDADNGYLLFRLKSTNRKGLLALRRDSFRRDREEVTFDTLDEDGRPREYLEFVGPRVYMEEYKNEFLPMRAVLESLPKRLVRQMVRYMNRTKAYMLLVNADQVEINFDTYYGIRQEVAIKRALRLSTTLASIFEVGEERVLQKAFIHLGGVAMGSLKKDTCSHCGQEVLRDTAGQCTNCGAVMEGG